VKSSWSDSLRSPPPTMPTTWLITGTNRGIGLGIVAHLSRAADNLIFATCRDPSNASQLSSLVASADCKAKIHLIKLDAKSEESIRSAAKEVERLIGDGRLDYLVNNAAAQTGTPTALQITSEAFIEDMKGNVLGPALIAQAFLSLLERSSALSKPPVVLNMSSGLGSIGLNYGLKDAVYSMTKSAINMLTYKQSAEKPNIIWICLDPGWVKTDMGGPEAQLPVEESVQSILKVITSVTIEDSGHFKHYSGADLPW